MNKELEKAIQTLDEAIPEPNNKMVDMAHLEICTAWERIKETLRRQNADQETGRWIEKEESGHLYCSRCGFTLDDEGHYSNEVQAQENKYCKNCGRKMEWIGGR